MFVVALLLRTLEAGFGLTYLHWRVSHIVQKFKCLFYLPSQWALKVACYDFVTEIRVARVFPCMYLLCICFIVLHNARKSQEKVVMLIIQGVAEVLERFQEAISQEPLGL
jgi:hypothetical protein